MESQADEPPVARRFAQGWRAALAHLVHLLRRGAALRLPGGAGHDDRRARRSAGGGRLAMSRGPSTFRQTDVTRAINGALAADVPLARIEVAPDGHIVIKAGPVEPSTPDPEQEQVPSSHVPAPPTPNPNRPPHPHP